MLAGVAEAEPDRIWFGRGGCVEQHDDGTYAVFVRGELLGIYAGDDVATRDMYIAVVTEQASREELARAFRVSLATVGRVVTRFNRGGVRAVADYGRRGGWTVRTPKLVERLTELFEEGGGPRAAHGVVAKHASYGTVHAVYREWKAARPSAAGAPPLPTQGSLPPASSSEVEKPAGETAPPGPAETAPSAETPGEPTLEAVAPPTGAVVQHVGSWLMLAGLREIGFHDLAAQHRGEAVAAASLRTAIDATAISLALGEGSVEGVRRIATPTAETLLRHPGGVTASWVRRVLHDFADASAKPFAEAMARRLLSRTGEGEDRVFLYVDNHLRPYTGQHVIRKGWRMQDKRAVPGTTDYYVHDEEGCPLWRMSTTSHDSLCAWLMPVVEFAQLSLGEKVTPGLRYVYVGRRIRQRMEALDIETASGYRSRLAADAGERDALDGMCRITISRFLRDRAVWEHLRDVVLPRAARLAVIGGLQELRCWSAGCASGQEPYGIALLFLLAVAPAFPGLRLRVLATDVDDAVLERARRGCFAAGAVRALPADWLARAFESRGGELCLRPEFREAVELRREDLRRAMPDGPFQLVLCRNLAFTYFADELQRRVLDGIAARLEPEGFLVVGAHESLPEGSSFAPAAGRLPIYARQ